MSGRSFRSVFMVASCATAALGCYLVSLRVASERAALEGVETQIVVAQRDIRVLQTEIGTRGRLAQLERWNAGAFALSAPSADQFLNGSFELARMIQPQHKVDFQAPVVHASAPTPEGKPAIGDAATDETGSAPVSDPPLLHQASLKTETREVPARPPATSAPAGGRTSTDKPAAAAKPADKPSVGRPGLAAAKPKKSVDKPADGAAGTVTRPVRIAKTDPLAPLPGAPSHTSRDHVSDR